jgi:hypothetical protein
MTLLAQRTRVLAGAVRGTDRGRSAAIGAVLLAGVVVAHLVNPYRDQWLPKCPFHELTGLWCPGCGATRSACALAHGDVWSAFRHNVLFLPAVGVLLWMWVAYSVRSFAPQLAQERWTCSPLSLLRRPWWLLATVILFWITRNVPGALEHALSS